MRSAKELELLMTNAARTPREFVARHLLRLDAVFAAAALGGGSCGRVRLLEEAFERWPLYVEALQDLGYAVDVTLGDGIAELHVVWSVEQHSGRNDEASRFDDLLKKKHYGSA